MTDEVALHIFVYLLKGRRVVNVVERTGFASTTSVRKEWTGFQRTSPYPILRLTSSV